MTENRAEQVKQERRRRRNTTVLTGQKLGVDESMLDRENYEYRWINDRAGRINAMTKNDDWDLVADPSKKTKEDATNEGSLISIDVGYGENNQPMKAYLARKPKKFFLEDQAAHRADLDKTMDAIKRGKPQTAEAQELGNKSYVPEGGISIHEGRRG